MKARRLVVIGLDGGTYDVLEPLMEMGAMPHLQALRRRGAFGELTSVVPPVTGPAWTAMATGISPWKCGAYSFVMSHRDSWTYTTISSAHLRGRAFWDLLAEAGHVPGVWNYPTLYPVYPSQGFMVSGILAAQNHDITWPTDLRDELTRLVGQYLIYVKYADKAYYDNETRFITDINDLIDQNTRVLQYLLHEKRWNVFTGVISAPDFIQHYMWKHWDRDHPMHDTSSEPYREAFVGLWRRIDDMLGLAAAACNDDTYLMIVSDHGFGPTTETFYLNVWLRENGFLVLKRGSAFTDAKKRALSVASGWLRTVDRRLGTRFLRSAKRFVNPVSRRYFDAFDLEQSAAISARISHSIEGIYLLDPKRRDELIEKLGKIVKPDGTPLKVQIHSREGICGAGDHEDAPDLFITVDDFRCQLPPDHDRRSWYDDRPYPNRTGGHRMNGMYLLTGPDVRAEQRRLDLLDVAPTLLYALKAAIPSHMDGKPRTELFNRTNGPDYVQRRAPDSSEAPSASNIEIEDVLKSLGYM